ncbi:MAG TPA: hypothetical protein VG753_03650 [Candidatus Paceibacterota bacterium]|nr:hypothetical protein [Candidatus Paceibacterota bacterium]
MPYNDPPSVQGPEPGYYYHYKHDPTKEVNDYAYYVYGVGNYTEDDLPPGYERLQHMQVYRPLYDSFVYKNGKMLDLRPLVMVWDKVQWQGKTLDRFTRITDREVIKQLQVIRRKMYPEELADWGN